MFFDNLQLIHTRGTLLETHEYYPFGLPAAAISYRATGRLENKIMLTGNEHQSGEFSDGSGLELYDFNARMYDAQIGRFNSVDPLAGMLPDWSGYSISFNNPIRFIDPSGLYPEGYGEMDAILRLVPPPDHDPYGNLHDEYDNRIGDGFTEWFIDDDKSEDLMLDSDGEDPPPGGKKGSSKKKGNKLLVSISTIIGGLSFSYELTVEKGKLLQNLANKLGQTNYKVIDLGSYKFNNGLTVKGLSRRLGVAGLLVSGGDAVVNGFNWQNGADIVVGIASFTPGIGWIIGLAYFIGDPILESTTGSGFGESFGKGVKKTSDA